MHRATRFLAVPLHRDLAIGGVAGLVGGTVFWWALHDQDMTPGMSGLLGMKLSGSKLALHLLVSVSLGGGFAAISSFQPLGYATTVSIGALYGLIWWIIGPLTFGSLIDGRGPTWSLGEAGDVFPSLIGHLLYGGITGLGFCG